MSAAAVKARKEAKRHERRLDSAERFCSMAEHTSRTESAVARCDGCGLLQVTRQGLNCFMCGSFYSTSLAAARPDRDPGEKQPRVFDIDRAHEAADLITL